MGVRSGATGWPLVHDEPAGLRARYVGQSPEKVRHLPASSRTRIRPDVTVRAHVLRAATPADLRATRELLAGSIGQSPYAALAGCADDAVPGGDECRALVADAGRDIIGVVVFGQVAGTIGAGKLHLVAVSTEARLKGAATELVRAALADLAARGARLVVAELADDPIFRPVRALLRRCGFVEEARIDDYYRDGVALIVLRHQIAR